MRDPERIPRILEKLGKLWGKLPDMRFLQLTSYLAEETNFTTHPFYVEDSDLENIIDKITEKEMNKK